MAYRFDNYDQALVIDGWENGIADNPYNGLADIRNVNLVSIPGEVSVNFATSSVTPFSGTDNVVSADSSADTVNLNNFGFTEIGQAVTFSGGSLPGGIVAGTVYFAKQDNGANYKLYTNFALTSLLDITTSGTGTWTTVNMGTPKYWTSFTISGVGVMYFMLDSNGRVWTNLRGGNTNFEFAGNTVDGSTSNGNGITAYVPSDYGTSGIAYVFVWRGYSIDYATITANTSIVWTNGWNPADGSSGNTNYLNTYSVSRNVNQIHEAITAPDNRVYYCDATWIGSFYEIAGHAFRPNTTSTYTNNPTQLLAGTDTAQCLAPLGTTLLIGGRGNTIYPWDRFSNNVGYPIQLAESNVVKMVTVNTNTYAFMGNRGRIYVTNGTNATLFKKIPDHISGTIEPYFTWGGACSIKNQLYFSLKATNNAGTTINQYGGVWGIDLDTKALRLTNKLSYGTYAGYAPALIPNFSSAPAGAGLYMAWDNGSSGYGIDASSGTPYTNGEATIDSDLIPIGTFNKPRDFTMLEYRLSRPLVSGESVKIKTRLVFNTTDTGYSTGWTDTYISPGQFSNTHPIDFQQAQWVQFQVVLTSTASSPSYVRLKEIRILGVVGPTMATSQSLSL